MKEGLFGVNIFRLFLIIIKKFNNSKWLSAFCNSFTIDFFNTVWLKKYIYIFLYKSLKLNLEFFLKHKFYTKDYPILILLESFEKFDNRLFRKNSKYFYVEEKRALPYRKFKLRISWMFYIGLGPQIEYFRYFLYLQYMKTCAIRPEMKYTLCERAYRHLELWRQHSISLSEDNYIFFELNREQIIATSNISLKSFNSVKKYTSIFWQYYFSISHKVFKKYWNNHFNISHSSFIKPYERLFFRLPLTTIFYKFIWLFVRKTEPFNKYKSLSPFTLFTTLQWAKFPFSYLVIIYTLRQNISKFNLWDECYFPIVKKNAWLHNLEVCLFEIFNKVHFHRLLIQFERDKLCLILPLFLTLWEVFIEFYYFDLTCVESYYSNYEELAYWSLLCKYNMERIICEMYWLAASKLETRLILQRNNEHYALQKNFFLKLFTITYENNFNNSGVNKGKNILLTTQYESLILKYYYSKYDSKFNFNLFKYNQYKERKLFLSEYIHAYKYYLFFKWNSEHEFHFPYVSGKWPKTRKHFRHIYYVM